MTEKIFSTDAYAKTMSAAVIDVDRDDGRVLLDRTVFYPGGGGQPHDVGVLRIGEDVLTISRVASDGDQVWHWLEGGLPTVGTAVEGDVDWHRRYSLMRTHTAMHALCGVIWSRFKAPVTGGDMKPGTGRLDFELPQWQSEFKPEIEKELNLQLSRALAVNIEFLDRATADGDPSLIRTKVSLLPAALTTVRVVDIVGLDRQADGGTHVESTGEVGTVQISKVESKGKGFRRIRLLIGGDADAP